MAKSDEMQVGPQALIGLEIENYKRIRLLKLPIGRGVTKIGGRNAQGKTSSIDALISVILGGKHIPQKPIREGEEEASVTAETTDFSLTRTWKVGADKNGILTVRLRDEKRTRVTAGQSLLTRLVGTGLAFNPHALDVMDAKERLETVRRHSTIDVDLDAIDDERAELVQRRLDDGRLLTAAQGALQNCPAVDGEEEPEESVGALLAELQAANEKNADRVRRLDAARGNLRLATENLERLASNQRSAKDARDVRLRALAATIERLQAELAEAKTRLADETAAFDAAEKTGAKDAKVMEAGRVAAEEAVQAAMALPTVETADLQARLANAETENAERRRRNDQRKNRARLAADVRARTETRDSYTKAIEALDAKKAAALKAAKFPLEGMSIQRGDVWFNSQPWEQLSASERLRIGFALALAGQPLLRVAAIEDASLLDDALQQEIAEIAAEHDCQVLMELVGTGDPDAWIIEDGAIARTPASVGGAR